MEDRRLLTATSNAGKLEEFRALLPAIRELSTLEDVLVSLADQTGRTFIGNTVLKAVSADAAARESGLPVLGDDSGLQVDALGGRLGVRPARYAERKTDSGN